MLRKFKIRLKELYFLLALPTLAFASLSLSPLAGLAQTRDNTTETSAVSPVQEKEKKTKKKGKSKESEEHQGPVLKAAEIMPEPPGGMLAYRQWIATNYNMPREAIAEGIKGELKVSFVVNKDGSLSNFKTEKDLGHGSAGALTRLLKKSKPWKPGMDNGENVRVEMFIPMTFNFQRSDNSF